MIMELAGSEWHLYTMLWCLKLAKPRTISGRKEGEKGLTPPQLISVSATSLFPPSRKFPGPIAACGPRGAPVLSMLSIHRGSSSLKPGVACGKEHGMCQNRPLHPSLSPSALVPSPPSQLGTGLRPAWS